MISWIVPTSKAVDGLVQLGASFSDVYGKYEVKVWNAFWWFGPVGKEAFLEKGKQARDKPHKYREVTVPES